MTALVTILIPNYKTPELTKLCLRLIRKFTDPQLIEVIAIDNHSEDASTQYLRSLKWIRLLERDTTRDKTPQLSHSNALDDALKMVRTPYVISFHTDTMVKRKGWLEFLLASFQDNPMIAGVGSWKLESKPLIRRLAKQLEYVWQSFYYNLIGKTDHGLEGRGNNYYYLRSHCAMYRMSYIRDLHLSFADGEDTAGKVMHKKLIDAGYTMIFLPSETLGQYVDHLNHATMILNPELGARNSTITKGLKRIKKGLKDLEASHILQDGSLDL
jgi:glycosyltransferase involved in cell wall biosynthesis